MHITDLIPGAEFVCIAGHAHVWEVPNMRLAKKALKELNANAYNWCTIQQPEGPQGRKPMVSVAFPS